jgi:NADH-quinone oxidoreductase subunit L
MALAGLSVVGGLINTQFFPTLESFLEPSFELVTMQQPPEDGLLVVILAGLAVLAAVGGMAAGFLSYRTPRERWLDFEQGFGPLWGTWEAAYRVDDLYGAVVVAPGKRAAELTAFGFDVKVIDGAVNGVGRLVRNAGDWTRTLQTGFVRNYGVMFLGGALIVVIWLVVGGM